MFKKIQNYGLPKNVFEKQVRYIALEALDNNENRLNSYSDLLRGFTEVSLYGWDNLTKDKFKRSTIELLKRFNLKKIDDISFTRNLDKDQKIEENLKRFDLLHNYFRQLSDVEVTETEKEFEAIISAFVLAITNYYNENYLPYIEEIEKQVQDKVTEINNSTSENKVNDLNEFLDQLEAESVARFEDLAEGLETETLNYAEEAILTLGGAKLATDLINKTKNFWYQEYLSNVKGNLAQFYRQTRESFSQDFRSFEDKVDKISINKNNIKLSVISEYKALFRNLIYESTKTDNYKAIIPYDELESINPSGETQKILYTIKTPKEFDNFANTTNVVNGFGIHHNSLEFYYPINELEEERVIAKEQRKELKSLLKDI